MGRKKNSKKKKRSKKSKDSRRNEPIRPVKTKRQINPAILAEARSMGIAVGGLTEKEIVDRIASLRS